MPLCTTCITHPLTRHTAPNPAATTATISSGAVVFGAFSQTTSAAAAKGATTLALSAATHVVRDQPIKATGLAVGTSVAAIVGSVVHLSAPTTAAIGSGATLVFNGLCATDTSMRCMSGGGNDMRKLKCTLPVTGHWSDVHGLSSACMPQPDGCLAPLTAAATGPFSTTTSAAAQGPFTQTTSGVKDAGTAHFELSSGTTVATGQRVSGYGVADLTTVSAISGTALTLSKGVVAQVPSGTTFTFSPTTATLSLTAATNVVVGQTVTAAGTYFLE